MHHVKSTIFVFDKQYGFCRLCFMVEHYKCYNNLYGSMLI